MYLPIRVQTCPFCSSMPPRATTRLAQLFGVGVPAISKHLKNIFEEGELVADSVISKMEITTQHGAIEEKTQTHNLDFFSLDAIIAVGFTGFFRDTSYISNRYHRDMDRCVQFSDQPMDYHPLTVSFDWADSFFR